MTRMHVWRLAPILLAAALTGCESTQTVPENETFAAQLSGAKEIPTAIATPATGNATFELMPNGTVEFTLSVQNITGVRMAHIHGPAGADRNAGVLVWLYPPGATAPGAPTGPLSGEISRGSFGATNVAGISMDSLVSLMRSGNVYVNVHTAVNGGGEIRGQIAPS